MNAFKEFAQGVGIACTFAVIIGAAVYMNVYQARIFWRHPVAVYGAGVAGMDH